MLGIFAPFGMSVEKPEELHKVLQTVAKHLAGCVTNMCLPELKRTILVELHDANYAVSLSQYKDRTSLFFAAAQHCRARLSLATTAT